MLKKIIIIENDIECQCDTIEEVVKKLIDKDFYEMTQEQKNKKMKLKALANCINNKMEVVQELSENNKYNIEERFIIIDEITYILSLAKTNNVILLERKDSNIFTKNLDKKNHLN